MATQYTPILQLALPVTGELNGTWGDVVNDNITSMVEEAIAGLATISTWTANSHTLTTADGVTDEARCAMLVATTGSGGTALSAAGEIICPARTKLFVLQNNAAYAVTLKTASGTGIAVAAGDTAFLFCDGTNVNACVTQIINGHITGNLTVDGNATVNGNTTLGNSTSDTITATGTVTSNLIFTDNTYDIGASGATRPRNLFLSGNATVGGNTTLGDATSDTVTVTARVASDLNPSADNTYDLGTSGNSWRNLYIDGTATIATLNVTTIDTTNLEVTNIKAKDGTASITLADSTGVATLSANPILNAGTANGVVYLNGSKSATSGGALTFDGATLGVGITPSTWSGGNTAIQIGASSHLAGISALTTGANYYYNSGNKYYGTGLATQYVQASGTHLWNIAPSGTAGNAITFTTAMTLDASGNLGLGVTPSAWIGSWKALQFGGSGSVASRSDGVTALFGQNYYINSSGTDTYINSDYATVYSQGSGQHRWYLAPSGTAGNAITFTQAMTLDTTGYVGIGIASPPRPLTVFKGISANNQTECGIALIRSGTTYGASIYETYSTLLSNEAIGFTVNSNTTITDPQYTKYLIGGDGTNVWFGATNATENLRLTSGGNLQFSNEGAIKWIQGSVYSGVVGLWGSSSTSNRGLLLGIKDNAGTYAEGLRVDNNTKVLVGNGVYPAFPTKLTLAYNSTTLSTNNFITIDNRGTNTTQTGSYVVGGILFSAFRDVRDPANIAGIWSVRQNSSGGLSSSGDLVFGTVADSPNNISQDGVLPTEAMRIKYDGNVGIGVAEPGSYKLNVNGSVQMLHGSAVGTGATGTAAEITLNSGSNNKYSDIDFAFAGTQVWRVGTNGGNNLQVFGFSGTKTNTFTTTGNLCIGTSSDISGVTAGGGIKAQSGYFVGPNDQSIYVNGIGSVGTTSFVSTPAWYNTNFGSADPSYAYVVLCDAYQGGAAQNKSFFQGQVIYNRGATFSGNITTAAWVDVSSAYLSNAYGGVNYGGIGLSIVTFLYNGAYRIGIRFAASTSACDVQVVGLQSGSMAPTLVADGSVSSETVVMNLNVNP